MKKISIFCLGLLGLLTSCKKNPSEELVGKYYKPPTSTMSINSQTGVNSCFNWQTSTYVTLTNGQTRTLPWYNGATTQIPNFVLEDYKKEEGWEMLYNFLSGTEIGQNYVIFYNKFTGIIRTYYFLSDDVTSGSNGMWGLGLSNSNSMLNNVGYFATPIDALVQDPLAISSNLSLDGVTKGVARGWNAFDTEITYDPNAAAKNIKMRILSSTSNISQVALTGDISLTSSGTIVSVGTKNGLQDLSNSAAKSGGAAAESWIKGKVKSDSSSFIKYVLGNAAATIAGGGVKAIISAGINLLFGSFIGKQTESTSTTQKIEFKTNGTLSISGTISSTSANNVSSVANIYMPGTVADVNNFLWPCFNKQMGVWNLQNTPIVRTFQRALYSGEGNAPDVGIYTRHYEIDPASINFVINPDVLTEIDSYEVKTDLFYYSKFKGNINWGGIGSGGNISGGILMYNDGENIFYKTDYSGNTIIESFSGPAPPPNEPGTDADFPTLLIGGFKKNFVVKVTLTLKPKVGYDQTPIVITRSYIPDYQYFQN